MLLPAEALPVLSSRFLEGKLLSAEGELLASRLLEGELVGALGDVVMVFACDVRRELVDGVCRNQSHQHQHDHSNTQPLTGSHLSCFARFVQDIPRNTATTSTAAYIPSAVGIVCERIGFVRDDCNVLSISGSLNNAVS